MRSTAAHEAVDRRGFLRIATQIGLGFVGAALGVIGSPASLGASRTGASRTAVPTGGAPTLGASTGGRAAPATKRFTHPDPRPDVDGSHVLGADEVLPHVAELFDGIRAIPHLADGIGCHCGCGAMPEMRSLLSCYEGIGMAQFCVICEGEGRLAVRLHAEGRSLDEIRAAIDRRYG